MRYMAYGHGPGQTPMVAACNRWQMHRVGRQLQGPGTVIEAKHLPKPKDLPILDIRAFVDSPYTSAISTAKAFKSEANS